MTDQTPPPLLCGAEAIGKYIGRTTSQTFHLLRSGMLPATHVGRLYCACPRALDAFLRQSKPPAKPEPGAPPRPKRRYIRKKPKIAATIGDASAAQVAAE